jgi:hypothetical protein
MKKTVWIFITLLSLVLAFFLFNHNNSPVIRADSPPSTIELTIPDFTVKNLNGKDTVTIPDGSLLSIVDKPYVPFIQKRFTYSAYFSIQNVTLVERSQIKEGKGLHIPNFKFEIDQPGIVPKVPDAEQKDWFPDKDFEWEIDEKPDGSKMLLVSIYPFFYNAKTTEYKYIQHYKLNVEFITTLLQIKAFKPDKDVFELSEPATFTADLYYQDNKPANLIANMLITDLEKKAVDQVPMVDLSGLEGETTNLTVEWKNDKKLAGTFYGRLEIRDLEEHLIDFKQVTFRVGRPDIQLMDFVVRKKQIQPNDTVLIFLEMKSKSNTVTDVRLLIRVLDQEKEIKRFERKYQKVKLNDLLVINENWKTIELVKGKKYFVIACAYYDSESSLAFTDYISTNTPPDAERDWNPEDGIVGEDITFDASKSTDIDGEIVKYTWNFGDNMTGFGKITTHRYNVPGTYKVKLSVMDNAGDISDIVRDIKVIARNGSATEKIIIRLYIGQKTYYINDIKKEMDTEPIIFQGRTLLPIRYVAEAIGATVGWVQAEQKATIVLKETNIELWIGKNSAKVNGEYKLIDASNPEVKPIVVPPGRTMLPIRFVAETLGCQVDWNQSTKEVNITYPK